MDRALPVVWALFVEYLGGGSVVAPAEVEAHLEGRASHAAQPAAPTLDTWGMDQAAQDGQRAMMQLLG